MTSSSTPQQSCESLRAPADSELFLHSSPRSTWPRTVSIQCQPNLPLDKDPTQGQEHDNVNSSLFTPWHMLTLKTAAC